MYQGQGATIIAMPTEGSGPAPIEEPTFDDFWLLYPRHIARKDASRAWTRLRPEDQVAALVALVLWRKIWLKRGELDYVPHAATWLNAERWTDEPPAPINGATSLSTFTPLPAKDRRAIPADVLSEIRRLRGKP